MGELNNSFDDYQRSLRAWAAESFRELRHTLDNRPSLSPLRNRPSAVRETSPDPPASSHPTEHADYSYGSAVDRLHTMMQRHGTKSPAKTVQFSDRSHASSSAASAAPSGGRSWGTATPGELVDLLQKQAGALQFVESENTYSKEELRSLKVKVTDLVEENRLLHEQIKRISIEEILGTDVLPTDGEDTKLSQSFDYSHTMTKKDYRKWHVELDRLTALHAAKSSRLEAQLTYTKEELQTANNELDAVKSKLRQSVSLAVGDALTAGLCVNCAQNEAAVALSVSGSQKQSLDALTRERDELMERVMRLRRRYAHLEESEGRATEQVKRSVVMVEQAQLEQTQALVQREQLKDELMEMRRRVSEHTEQMAGRLAEERETARRECDYEHHELQTKIKELSVSLVDTQTQLERLAREKLTLASELQSAHSHINSFDTDYGKATDSMKMSMTQATFQRNAAMQEMQRVRKDLSLSESEHEQERSRLKAELKNVRERLETSERRLVESREEYAVQANGMLSLEREVHQMKLSKESLEKNRSDDLKSAWQRSEQREQQLNMMIDTLQTRHDHAISELDDLVTGQATLVQKLRDECRHLAGKLEQITKKYKGDNKRLKSQNDQMRVRLSRLLQRLQEVEDQHALHADMTVKLRERLVQMESHAQGSSQQIVDLLAKQSRLMRHRQALGREVDFLRRQFTDTTRPRNYPNDTGGRGVDRILADIHSNTGEKDDARPQTTFTFDDDGASDGH